MTMAYLDSDIIAAAWDGKIFIEVVRRHKKSYLCEQGHLMVAVVCPGIGDIVQDIAALQPVSLRNC